MKRSMKPFKSGRPPAYNHGALIYAYCNIRTNQVLYSLRQSLDHTALKQLPDAGKNHTPASMRKDLWKPLWILAFEASKFGCRQGLDAFRRLREYRRLHETNWEPPALLSRPYTEDEIERLNRKLANRGGSKEETAYDLIKREKKKLRVNMVLDQKARSVADLAAMLVDQEDYAKQVEEEKELEKAARRDDDIRTILQLDEEARNGGLSELDRQIAERIQVGEMRKRGVKSGEPGLGVRKSRARLKDLKIRRSQMRQVRKAMSDLGVQKRLMVVARWRQLQASTLKTFLDGLEEAEAAEMDRFDEKIAKLLPEVARLPALKLSRLESGRERRVAFYQVAKDARAAYEKGGLENVRMILESLENRPKQIAEKATIANMPTEAAEDRPETVDNPPEAAHSTSEAASVPEERLMLEERKHVLKAILRKVEHDRKMDLVGRKEDEKDAKALGGITPEGVWNGNPHTLLPLLPPGVKGAKYSKALAKNLNLEGGPIFTLKDVSIKWQNPLDAEYAKRWPHSVQHLPMGLTRHTAPKMRSSPVFDVQKWTELNSHAAHRKKSEQRRMEKDSERSHAFVIGRRILDGMRQSPVQGAEQGAAHP